MVSLAVAVLGAYAAGLMALGLWIGRRVRGSADFFVAGRRLGPGLLFSTMLAANIGAGSTVGATALAYRSGIGAWWWVGLAAAGTAVLALVVGPSIRREAAAYDLRTVGDYLEHRYNPLVRQLIALLVWLGGLAILGGELLALAWILNVVAGVPMRIGCFVGALVITVYFAAGGLLTTAWVNVAQLGVKLGGFALAVPLALIGAGGWAAVRMHLPDDPSFWIFWKSSTPGVLDLALVGPAFIASPGLLQKIFGARDDHAVRVGVGFNALALLAFAAVPVLLGLIARSHFAALPSADLALPTILMRGVPPLIGTVGLAAVFSAEISAADAVLFMLTTSVTQDVYKQLIDPLATDSQILFVARWTAVVSGALAAGLAIAAASVIGALSLFYSLIGVSLLIPLLAGLYVPRATSTDALLAIVCGIGGLLGAQLAWGERGWNGMTPALTGLGTATTAWLLSFAGRHLAASFAPARPGALHPKRP